MTILATTELDLAAARRLLDDPGYRRISFYAGVLGIVLVALVSLSTGAVSGPRPGPVAVGTCAAPG